MIKYSNGQNFNQKPKNSRKISVKSGPFSHGNRGMNLEDDINLSNDFYRQKNLCLITKRPTPINVVKVDYTKGAIITSAYFEKQSTTDYNGVYKGRYIDFEAKSTLKNTSFPLANISKHQIEHLKKVIYHNGIAFFIIEFARLNQVFLLDASFVINFYENGERKSIPYETFLKDGHLIKKGFAPRLNYLDVIEEIYVKS